MGKTDVVEFRSAGPGAANAARTTPFPIEYKRGRPKTHDADRVQLCAQALCLEEMLSLPEGGVPAGALYCGAVRRRVDVAFDIDVPRAIMNTVGAARAETGGILLGPKDSDTITEFHFDAGGTWTGATYSPDVKTLNARLGAEVAHYRAEEDSRRMRFRLARLIDLHTNYLEPLLRLIDIGGEFYGVSEQVVASCDRLAVHALPGTHSPISLLATAASRDVVWLRRGTLRRAHEAHRELGPLCEAAMRESAIARGVNRALEAIGSGRWERLDLDRQLAVIVAPDGPLLNDRAAVACLLAARSYRDTPPPLLGPEEPASMDVPWTVASLREELDTVGAVEDVFEWICERVGRDQPDPPAALLHDLIEAAPECLSVVGSETHQYPFARIEVEGRVWAWKGESHA